MNLAQRILMARRGPIVEPYRYWKFIAGGEGFSWYSGGDGKVYSLYQLKLFTTNHASGVDYALGSVASASEAANGHGPELAVDGSNATRWGGVWPGAGNAGKWIAVDLGVERPILSATFIAYQDQNGIAIPEILNIEASKDEVTWVQFGPFATLNITTQTIVVR